jgi:hypothetical protein
MARYSEYLDYDGYLPGDVARAGLSEYQQYPQLATEYIRNKRFKFQPKENINLFQNFLALQGDPERLFRSTAKMPDTPFGNLSGYAGI